MASRLAVVLAPIAARAELVAVPIFWPMISAQAWSSPTATSTNTPKSPDHHRASGAARTAGRSAGCNRSASPPMPCCRVVSPKSTSPNPASAAPTPAIRPRARSLVNAPTKIIGSAAAVSETRTPMSATSQPVPVVPTFAPKTRPNPCWNVNKPALTRPIVVMVVALEDCTRSVTIAPQKEPSSGVAAALPSTVRRAEPASAFNPSVITVMPSRNRPTPPSTEIAVDMGAPKGEWRSGQVLHCSAVAERRQPTRLHYAQPARAGLLFFAAEGRAYGLQLPPLRRVDGRVGEVECLNRLHNDRGNHETGEPFVVGRHDVPRSMFGCRRPDSFLERVHVVVPELALVYVGGREFPVLVRSVEARQEALPLLLARQVQEKLENDGALPSEVILKMRDVEKPLVPDALAHERRGQVLPP